MRYEKGRKDASRRRIVNVAAERFRTDGIAASGITGIMSAAGLTNGAFSPHFQSKAELVGESLVAALADLSNQLGEALATGGFEAALAQYLSLQHRDDPGTGCPSAALLPEVARQPVEVRDLYTQLFIKLIGQMAESLPPGTKDAESVSLGVYATMVGALQLARATRPGALSDRILAIGADAARTLIEARQDREDALRSS
ncbi:MAG TPA: TetR/AcrR family transcriptional regulator [Sphingomicrobium sp.]